jgi:hypothetical protein
VVVVVGAMLSGPIAVLIVNIAAPQPEWSDVASFAQHFHPIQTLPYLLGFVLLAGFVMFVVACHAAARGRRRARAMGAVVATAVYAALVFTNYVVQVGFIPRVVAERPSYIALLTMSNPASFAWFLEMFGYAALGVATVMISSAFGGSVRSTFIRALLAASGVLSVLGAMFTALIDRWVFSPAGFASFAGWNALVVICFLMIAASPDAGLRPSSRARRFA